MPCSPPGDLPNPGIKPRSLTLWADSLLSEPPEKPSKVSNHVLFGEFMEDYSLGDSLSDRAEGLYKRVDGRAMIYSGFTGKKKKKVKYQKNRAKDKSQTSQVNDFSAFLFMGRCESLGLLKSFLRYAS